MVAGLTGDAPLAAGSPAGARPGVVALHGLSRLDVPEPQRWGWHRFAVPEGRSPVDDDVVVFDEAEGLVHRLPGLSHWLATQWLESPGPHTLDALVLALDDPQASVASLSPWLLALASIGLIRITDPTGVAA